MANKPMEQPIKRAPVPGTAADDQDMMRMHKPQQLNVSTLLCAEKLMTGGRLLQACIQCGNTRWLRRHYRLDMALFARVSPISDWKQPLTPWIAQEHFL